VSLGRNGGAFRRRRHAFSALGTAALALAVGGAIAAPAGAIQTDPAAGSAASPAAPLSTRVIVQWRRGSDHVERVEARADAGVAYAGELGDPNFQLVLTQPGDSAAAAAQALEEDPAVVVAEPDSLRSVDAVPNDPRFAEEWGLQNTGQTINGLAGGKSGNDINVISAWDRTVGTPTTVVADIDTGYRSDSPDLGPVEWTNPGEIAANGIDDDGDGFIDDVHGWDFVGENVNVPTPDNNPDDTNVISGGHGVHTAGTIGAKGNDGIGITGVAQNIRIMPLRVCSNEPSINEVRCATSAIIAAINYAGARGARVANMSLGGTAYNQTEVNAIAAHPGTLYVISAGNDAANNDSGLSGTAGHHYPCDYKPTTQAVPAGTVENVICVAALDPSEALASYSDYGATSVDLAAPGTSVLSTFPATETVFSDNFETDDFASKWTPYGAPGFARAGVGEGPLTSFGITDTPGKATEASHTYGVKLTSPFAVPAGTGACRVEGKRFRKGGGTEGAPYGVTIDGTFKEFFGGETSGSAMASFRTVLITGLGGHSVAPFFEYRATAAPAAGDGLWLDDVALRCNSPLSVPPTYGFLDGTSMAAPHVTGAAALLFSLKPTATVAEVRSALLAKVTPVAGLAGKTTTGGRLNVAAAMEQLVPLTGPQMTITEGPSGPTASGNASFKFTNSGFNGTPTTECSLDGAAFATCSSPATYGSQADGAHEFGVRGEDSSANTASATRTWTVDTTPPTLAITEGPTGTTEATTATFKFTTSDPTGPVTTECSLDGATFATCASPKAYAGLANGAHEFDVRAKDGLGNAGSSTRSWTVLTTTVTGNEPPPGGGTLPPETSTKIEELVRQANPAAPTAPPPTVPTCTVPKLAGETLGQAKAALSAARCTLGKVTSPKVPKGSKPPKLVVKTSTPGSGSQTGGPVAIKLAAKPKGHRH
jgi:subtilisin family serine protease